MSKSKGFFFQLMTAILMSKNLNHSQKQTEAKSLNRKSGGMLFSNGPIYNSGMNQRQKRKLNRQTQNFR